jgi:hypothetical protein
MTRHKRQKLTKIQIDSEDENNEDDKTEILKQMEVLKSQMMMLEQKMLKSSSKGQKKAVNSTLNAESKPFESTATGLNCTNLSSGPSTSVTMTQIATVDPTANLLKNLADAIRMLQLNAASSAEHTGSDPDEQLKLTMIRASLPELPKYSGTLEEWPLFERIFTTTSETGKYTEELNHLHLLKCLEGDAKSESQRLLSGMAGGTAIMNHLKAVYGDDEKILKKQVKKL